MAWDAGFEHAVSEAATQVVSGLARGLSIEVVARGSRSPLLAAGASADPILRYLALLSATPVASAQAFGAYARNAGVVRVRVATARDTA